MADRVQALQGRAAPGGRMNKKIVTAIVVCIAGVAFAQVEPVVTADAKLEQPAENAAPADTAAPVVTDAAKHEGLRRLKDTMERALNARDLDALVANVDENVVFTTMNGDVARGRQGIRDYFAKMMEGPDKIVETITSDFEPDDLSLLFGDDVAVAVGGSKDHYVLTDGRQLDIAGRWTATLVNRDGRWLVAAFHYSTNVFDNPVLETQRKYLLLGGAGVAVLLALIGWFVGRRSGNRATA
jgi:uncharacterized protein (TIGR02246 family)